MAIETIDCSQLPDAQHQEIAQLFVDLPKVIYRDDPLHIPSPGKVEAGLVREELSPVPLLATDGGEHVARVVAMINPALDGYGLLGFFEAQNNPDAVRELLLRAVQLLRERGADKIIGPMNGDTWHTYRFNVGPYDRRPFLMEPHNPPYYPALWEGAGFRVLQGYYSKAAESIAEIFPRYAKIEQRARDNGYTFRTFRPDRFRDELDILYDLSISAFSGNFLYTDIPREEFVAMYDGVGALLDPELIWFAQAPDGSYVGFVFAVPDRFEAVRAMRGGRGLMAKLRFFLNRKTDAVNMKTLGVVPEHRRSGLGSVLMTLAYRRAFEKGYVHANLCLIRDGNPSGKLDNDKGEAFRRYHLYEYAGE